jgi:hypothetical protein
MCTKLLINSMNVVGKRESVSFVERLIMSEYVKNLVVQVE